MAFTPLNGGSPKAGSDDEGLPCGAMLYVNVACVKSLKLNVNVPTAFTVVFEPPWKNATLLATNTLPASCVGVTQLPPDMTIHSGLKSVLSPVLASGSRGSSVYMTAYAWL